MQLFTLVYSPNPAEAWIIAPRLASPRANRHAILDG